MLSITEIEPTSLTQCPVVRAPQHAVADSRGRLQITKRRYISGMYITDDEETGGRESDGADEGEVRKKSAVY